MHVALAVLRLPRDARHGVLRILRCASCCRSEQHAEKLQSELSTTAAERDELKGRVVELEEQLGGTVVAHKAVQKQRDELQVMAYSYNPDG